MWTYISIYVDEMDALDVSLPFALEYYTEILPILWDISLAAISLTADITVASNSAVVSPPVTVDVGDPNRVLGT